MLNPRISQQLNEISKNNVMLHYSRYKAPINKRNKVLLIFLFFTILQSNGYLYPRVAIFVSSFKEITETQILKPF